MEEVDGIVLVSLRQLGVPLPENITSLRQFDTQTLFQSVVAYMKVIDPDKKLPDNLPKEVGSTAFSQLQQQKTKTSHRQQKDIELERTSLVQSKTWVIPTSWDLISFCTQTRLTFESC